MHVQSRDNAMRLSSRPTTGQNTVIFFKVSAVLGRYESLHLLALNS